MTGTEGPTPTIDLAIAWLTEHPNCSARTVAASLRLPAETAATVFGLLEQAETDGLVRRWRKDRGPFLWEVV